MALAAGNTSDERGGNFVVRAGSAVSGGAVQLTSGRGTDSSGGAIVLSVSDGTSDEGGQVSITGGRSLNGDLGGLVALTGGEGGLGGPLLVTAGAGSLAFPGNTGGSVLLKSGGSGQSTTGAIAIHTSAGAERGGVSGHVTAETGLAQAGDSGSLVMETGTSSSGGIFAFRPGDGDTGPGGIMNVSAGSIMTTTWATGAKSYYALVMGVARRVAPETPSCWLGKARKSEATYPFSLAAVLQILVSVGAPAQSRC